MCLHLVSLITIIGLPRILRVNRRSQATPLTSPVSSTSTIPTSTNTTTQSTSTESTCLKPLESVTDVCDTNILHNTKQTKPNGIKSPNKHVVIPPMSAMPNSMNGNGGAVPALHKNNLSFRIREKIDNETRNIENFIDNAVTGIVELKDDLMRMQQSGNGRLDGLYKRTTSGYTTESPATDDLSRKHVMADALNQANNNMLPSVISNGNGK